MQVKKTKELEPLPSFSIGLTQMEEEGRNVTDGDKNKKQKTKEAKGKEKKQHIKNCFKSYYVEKAGIAKETMWRRQQLHTMKNCFKS